MAETTALSQQLGQFKVFVGGLSGRQKLLLGAGAAVVAATLFLFVQLSQKNDMKLLYSGMEPSEAQALIAQLNAKNIDAKLSADATGVEVPADKLDAARLEVASKPSPRSGRMGFELFDKTNWAASDFDERVTYQRALEGELERTLASMNGVDAVRVHLTMARESLFLEKEQGAKAAVIVKLKSGRVTPNMQASIARLVSSSVDKLAPEAVTVVDANTNRAIQLQQSPAADADGLSLSDSIALRVEKALEPIVGADHVKASVQVQFENTNSEENQEVYEPNSAVAVSVQRSEEITGSSQAGGPVGTASNLPSKSPAPPARTDSTQSSSRSENSTYVVNKLVRHTVRPAGGIRRITAAVLIDDAIAYTPKNGQQAEERQKRSPEQIKQIEELARAAIGFDATRGDTITVQNISFLTLPPEQPVPPTRAERARKVLNDYSSLLRIAVLAALFGIIYLLVLRPVKKQIVTAFDKAPQLTARTSKTALAAGTPEEELLAQPELAPEVKRTAQLRNQLAQKVREQPAAAAQLVQSWLREDQR